MESKQRHGCVTSWLVFMIVINSVTAILYLFAGDMVAKNLPGGIPTPMLILLAIVCICNVVFSTFLFLWKRWAFWGFAATSVVTFIINLSIGIGIVQSVMGLIGIAVLYGVLNIKKADVAAWDHLE
jgi:hypothetical protein